MHIHFHSDTVSKIWLIMFNLIKKMIKVNKAGYHFVNLKVTSYKYNLANQSIQIFLFIYNGIKKYSKESCKYIGFSKTNLYEMAFRKLNT